MASPILTPTSQTSAIILPSGSTPAIAAAASFPFTVYTSDEYFLSGASDQVAYTYRKMGGDVLDIELTKEQVFAAQYSSSQKLFRRYARCENRLFQRRRSVTRGR